MGKAIKIISETFDISGASPVTKTIQIDKDYDQISGIRLFTNKKTMSHYHVQISNRDEVLEDAAHHKTFEDLALIDTYYPLDIDNKDNELKLAFRPSESGELNVTVQFRVENSILCQRKQCRCKNESRY
ncbi:hypothetical protein [Aureibacter tunicatorum]|uniref:Uncharacterized protein n=1 Tax=Aureibacter tunicatorum TaxID=866807 RepID=A0AAE3XN37_9BACT|nr:hypothetical protein [Aureibacter tunicatorum]MDR6240966.1 hypothetical protein [Aureibacter tunicatorum]BDD03746.1 hypothetical protein AUTU_12290 [Aureibacter tunicatorum]